MKAILGVLVLGLLLTPVTWAQEKLKIASSVKVYPGYYLPILAAQENGFFKANGLDVEWVPFAATFPMLQAVAGGHVYLGLTLVEPFIESASAGIPAIIVAELVSSDPFRLWVRADSKIKEAKDLKGAKIGGPRLSRGVHPYGHLIAKRLGIDKDVTFASVGGIPEMVAALKTGVIDAVVQPLAVVAGLKARGDVREIASAADFLPREWSMHAIFAEKAFADKNPATVKMAIASLLKGIEFVRKNPSWAIGKMREMNGWPEEVAREVYDGIKFSRDGKTDGRALEGIENFMIDYGIVSKEKALRVEDLYTNKYVE